MKTEATLKELNIPDTVGIDLGIGEHLSGKDKIVLTAPKTTKERIKELLKPPFALRVNKYGTPVIVDDGKERAILQTYIEGKDERLVIIAQFAVQALNNEWEREYGEKT